MKTIDKVNLIEGGYKITITNMIPPKTLHIVKYFDTLKDFYMFLLKNYSGDRETSKFKTFQVFREWFEWKDCKFFYLHEFANTRTSVKVSHKKL